MILAKVVYADREADIFKGGYSIEAVRIINKNAVRYLMKQGKIHDPARHNFGL